MDALVTFDAEYRESAKWAGWQDRGQFKYAISHDDRLYPVKMIIELATGMDRRVIYGGTQANGYVKHYGFTVVQLRDLSSPWDAFIHWAKRFEGKYEGERSYKVRIATNLRQAREALLSNSEVWPALLRKSFGAPADLTPWQANSRFLTWCDSDPQAAKLALGALWSDTKPFTVGFRACVDAVPGNVFSDGYELPIVSFLLMAEDEAMYPVFRAEPFAAGFRLTGYPSPPIVGSKAERAIARYEHGLGFLDELREQAQRRGLALRDRLDARSALQAVTKWQPGADDGWSEADRQAFLAYQKGGVPASCTPEDGIAALAQRLLLDESYLARIQQMLHAKRQVIFYGPPGTGKTYVARELARFCA
ncbi:MAG: ATP-binding protein, partial [Gemmatimonadota bacterium]|nr:ATP-binding protein [Gemmatimonadota bacterium]